MEQYELDELAEQYRRSTENKIIEEPILTIEDISVKLLSKEFIDWYFKDKQANRIINLFKQSQKQKIIEEIEKVNMFYEGELSFAKREFKQELLKVLGEKQ